MVINIQGTILDLPSDFAIVKSAKAFRFSDGVSSEWSTSATLPKTPANLAALGVADMMDGGEGVYKDPIPFVANVGMIQAEGFVRVESYSEDGIGVSFYFKTKADGDLGRKLSDIMTDDSDTFPATGYGYTGVTTTLPGNVTDAIPIITEGWGYIPMAYVNQPDSSLFAFKPGAIHVDGVLERLGNALGYRFAATGEDLYVIPTRRALRKNNGRQVIYFSGKDVDNGSITPATLGGMCVCNDYAGSYAQRITWNRRTRINRMALTTRCTTGNYANGTLQVYINSTLIWTYTHTMGTPNDIVSYQFANVPFWVSEGDELQIIANYNYMTTEIQAILELDQQWDDVLPDDNNRLVDYIYQEAAHVYGGDIDTWDSTPMLEPRQSGQPLVRPSNYYYNYYGAIAQLPDITVGEFLQSVGWIIGRKPVWDGWQWQWELPNKRYSGELVVDSLEPYSDRLGKVTAIGYKSGGDREYKKNNGFIEDEVWAHKSVFSRPGSGSRAADLALFDGNNWRGDDANCIVATEWNAHHYLTAKQPPMHPSLRVDTAQAVSVKGRCRCDLSGYDIVEIGGREALLVEFEWDAATNVSSFTALLCHIAVSNKKNPYNIVITPIVSDSQKAEVRFIATAEDLAKVPVVNIVTTEPGVGVSGYAVQQGDNALQLVFTPSTQVDVSIEDDAGVYPTETVKYNVGSGGYAVDVKAVSVSVDDGDVITIGFEIKGNTDGSKYYIKLYETGKSKPIDTREVKPVVDADGFHVYDSATGGVFITCMAKSPFFESFTIEASAIIGGVEYSGTFDFKNPLFVYNSN